MSGDFTVTSAVSLLKTLKIRYTVLWAQTDPSDRAI